MKKKLLILFSLFALCFGISLPLIISDKKASSVSAENEVLSDFVRYQKGTFTYSSSSTESDLQVGKVYSLYFADLINWGKSVLDQNDIKNFSIVSDYFCFYDRLVSNSPTIEYTSYNSNITYRLNINNLIALYSLQILNGNNGSFVFNNNNFTSLNSQIGTDRLYFVYRGSSYHNLTSSPMNNWFLQFIGDGVDVYYSNRSIYLWASNQINDLSEQINILEAEIDSLEADIVELEDLYLQYLTLYNSTAELYNEANNNYLHYLTLYNSAVESKEYYEELYYQYLEETEELSSQLASIQNELDFAELQLIAKQSTIDNLNAEITLLNAEITEKEEIISSLEATSNVFGLIKSAFAGVVPLFDFELAPNITIGMILTIPFVIAILSFAIKLIG